MKVRVASLILAYIAYAHAQKQMTFTEEVASKLGLNGDLKYILEEASPTYSDRSLRPTSYYTPPPSQSPRYTYTYKNRPIKKKTYGKKEFANPAVANTIEGSTASESGKYPAIQIYMA